MEITLKDYQEVVGPGVIEELHILADRARDRRVQHINSTPVGGGVAEILTRLIPLFRELGVDATWDVIKGDQAFFNVTKAFHNALHGNAEEISREMYDIFRSTTEMNFARFDGQAVTVDDFVTAMAEAGGLDLSRFMRWYSQAGTPEVTVATTFDPMRKTLALTCRQSLASTPGQPPSVAAS